MASIVVVNPNDPIPTGFPLDNCIVVEVPDDLPLSAVPLALYTGARIYRHEGGIAIDYAIPMIEITKENSPWLRSLPSKSSIQSRA